MTTKKTNVNPAEQSLRDAAAAFADAMRKAEEAGFRVHWPVSANGLDTLSISETARVDSVRLVPVMEEAAKEVKGQVTIDPHVRVKVNPPPKVDRAPERVQEVPVAQP